MPIKSLKWAESVSGRGTFVIPCRLPFELRREGEEEGEEGRDKQGVKRDGERKER